MALNTVLTDAAAVMTTQLAGGSGTSKVDLGGGGVAFGWAAGMVPTIANYVTAGSTDGMTYNVTTVSESPTTPAAVVAENAPKPNAAVIQSSTATLKKHAGLAVASLEAFLNAKGLAQAINSVLGNSCLKSFEKDALAALGTAAGTPVTGASWVEAIANAQAAMFSVGGAPTVLVISPADYGGFVADIAGLLTVSAESPIGQVLGTPVHASVGATAGAAYLVDGAAVLAVQHSASPVAIADTVSMADTNQSRLVVDLIASTFVADPARVIEITPPAPV